MSRPRWTRNYFHPEKGYARKRNPKPKPHDMAEELACLAVGEQHDCDHLVPSFTFANDRIYDVNPYRHTCTCPDFINRRARFQAGTPERLCKHLVLVLSGIEENTGTRPRRPRRSPPRTRLNQWVHFHANRLAHFAIGKEHDWERVVFSFSGGDEIYHVNPYNHSCTCSEFLELRERFQPGTPDRLCKHLVWLLGAIEREETA